MQHYMVYLKDCLNRRNAKAVVDGKLDICLVDPDAKYGLLIKSSLDWEDIRKMFEAYGTVAKMQY